MELAVNTNLIKTETELNALGNKDIVELYNDLAEALKLDPVRRFADKATAVKRTLKLVAEYMKANKTAAAPAPVSAPAKKTAAKAPKVAGTSNVRRGTNLQPLGHEPQACREGTKQALLLDMLRTKEGATMAELIEGLSGGNKPWTEATVRSGFGWDLKNKGYGVRSTFDADGTERFFIVLPEKFPTIPAHTPLKSAKPKADARQKKLA